MSRRLIIRAAIIVILPMFSLTSTAQRSRTTSPSNQNEMSLVGIRPVEGEWLEAKNRTISGRLFDVVGGWHMNGGVDREAHHQVVFANRSGWETLDAFVGWKGMEERRPGTLVFVVLADGKEVVRSPRMRDHDDPFHISVSVKGKQAITLIAEADADAREAVAYWALPKLTLGKPPSSTTVGRTPNGGSEDENGDAAAGGGTKILRLDEEKLKALATALKEAVQKDTDLAKTKPKLAVAKFVLVPADELSQANAINVREDLTTELIDAGGFSIVERGQLEQAVKELKLNLSDTFDSAKAQQLGKLIGARLVLVGSISDRDGKYTVINARMIDTQTGEIHSAARVEIRQ